MASRSLYFSNSLILNSMNKNCSAIAYLYFRIAYVFYLQNPLFFLINKTGKLLYTVSSRTVSESMAFNNNLSSNYRSLLDSAGVQWR